MSKTTSRVAAALVCALVVSTAFAQEAERPWAKGVSPQDQQAALALFRDGNSALKESLFVDAAKKYKDALAVWDHPAIHYNLALVLLNLDQPVEVYEHLEAAMKFGPAPLDSDKYEQAARYKKLVQAQLATLEVKCDEPGAQVVMDGKELFTGPGKWSGVIRSGPHSFVASKEGFMTQTRSAKLPSGETTSLDLKLYTADDLTQYRRRWSAWVPWSVVGAGAAAVGLGAAMHMSAKSGFDAYDQGITDCGIANPDDGGGCRPTATLIGQKQGAETSQSVAMAAYGLGAAALVTGGVLMYMNRLMPYSVTAGDTQVEVTVAPALAPAGGGASALIKF